MVKIKFNPKFLIFLLVFLSACVNSNQNADPKIIHKAHLNSGWYPQDLDTLNKDLNLYFETARKNFDVVNDYKSIKVVIVPHAGFYFSGLCAASVYQNLFADKNSCKQNSLIKKVIILAPTHVKAFKGISLPDYDVYQTVFGQIEVDQKSVESLAKDSLFSKVTGTHSSEHSIEIQLPFLQKVLRDFKIVPLIVGFLEQEDYLTICKSLKEIVDDSTLIVVSSDFTHYGPNYDYAPFDDKFMDKVRYVDFLSVDAIIHNSFDQFDAALKKTFSTVCGKNAIKILLKMIEEKTFNDVQARVCCYYNSAQLEAARKDGAFDVKKLFEIVPDENARNFVSYVGIFFTTQKLESLEKQNQLTAYEKQALLKLARSTMKNYFAKGADKLQEHLLWPVVGLGADKQAGAFVTLNTKSGDLRGCIGRIIADEPLYKTVQQMSKASAFEDHRFEPVKENELENIVIDISVLTSPTPVASYKDIVIGKHGVILKKILDGKMYSSVFLPQVPPSFGWNLERTLEQLSLKAGLGRNEWKQGCNFEVFEGFEFKED